MKRLIIALVVSLIGGLSIQAQTNVTITIDNYDNDSLLLGYYYADKILVKDTLYLQDDSFTYRQDTLTEPGMYIAVTMPDNQFYQILFGVEDQDFSVHIDAAKRNAITFEGSEENRLFYDYLDYMDVQRGQLAKIDNALSTTDSIMVSVIDQLRKDRHAVNALVAAKQQELIATAPTSIATLLVKANLPFTFPEFTGTPKEIEEQKYNYYKARYFDETDLLHPAIQRTPVLHQRVEYYLDKLTPRSADSINNAVDLILTKMEPNTETFQYYLSYFLNDYGNSKFIGMDAVYVHLALEYYAKGKAPWISEDNLKEIVDNATKLAPILIGEPAPDFTIFEQDGSEVKLSDFDNDYTVLVFWRPDCSHCTEAMPHVIDFNEKYKAKGIDLLSICTSTGKKYAKCWEDVTKKKMDNLLNTGDEHHRSRIFSKYYITSTPQIYILDKDKNIKLKKVPAENLEAVMEEIMKMDAAKAAESTE